VASAAPSGGNAVIPNRPGGWTRTDTRRSVTAAVFRSADTQLLRQTWFTPRRGRAVMPPVAAGWFLRRMRGTRRPALSLPFARSYREATKQYIGDPGTPANDDHSAGGPVLVPSRATMMLAFHW